MTDTNWTQSTLFPIHSFIHQKSIPAFIAAQKRMILGEPERRRRVPICYLLAIAVAFLSRGIVTRSVLARGRRRCRRIWRRWRLIGLRPTGRVCERRFGHRDDKTVIVLVYARHETTIWGPAAWRRGVPLITPDPRKPVYRRESAEVGWRRRKP